MDVSKSARITKNTLFLYIRSFFVLLISLYTSRVVLDVLGIEDYGIYNVVGGVVGMLSFLNTSMSAAYQRFYNYEMGQKNLVNLSDLFRSSLAVQFIYAIFIVIIAETLGLWYLDNYLVIPHDRVHAAQVVYHVSVLSFALSTFQAPFTALIIAYEKMGIFAVVSMLDAILKLLIVFLLPIIPGDKLVLYSMLMVIIICFNTGMYLIICKTHFSVCKLSFSWNRANLRKLLSFSTWGAIDSMSYTLKSQGLNILLNIFGGPVVNAARGVSYQILTAVNQFITSFQTAFRPQIIKLYSEGALDSMYKLYYSATKISCYLLWCISLPIILEISYILTLWLGDNVPYYAPSFSRIILLTALVSAYANPTSCIAYATGKIKSFTIFVSGFNLIIIPVAYIFLKLGYGPESAMIVSLVVSILVQLIRIAVVRTLIPFPVRKYITEVVIPTTSVFIISSILPIICHICFVHSQLSAIFNCMICVFSVIVVTYFIGLNEEERTLLKSKFKYIINNLR